MTSPTDHINNVHGLFQDMSTQSGAVRKKSELQQALDELTSLPRDEMLSRIDARQAGAIFERFFACDKNKDCHSHSMEDAEHVSRVVGDYRRFDAQRLSRSSPRNDASRPSDETVDIIEVFGSIKWFDPAKGYGFIVPDNGGPEVLLHVTCLRAGGYHTAYEGTRIHCEAIRRPKAWQAFHILSMDQATAIHPAQLPQRTHDLVRPESDWERAIVKWFNRVRGFGFLSSGENTTDIFVHMETLRRFGFNELRPGETVEVRWGLGSKGVMAAELRPVTSPPSNKN